LRIDLALVVMPYFFSFHSSAGSTWPKPTAVPLGCGMLLNRVSSQKMASSSSSGNTW